MDRPTLYVLTGPTGIGKSNLGILLAKRYNGEIISADSRQIYRYMDIGTGKPALEERGNIPHHLMDLFSPDEAVSAGRYARLVKDAMKNIWERGKKAFFVGGSGLYIRASLKGLFEGQGRDEAVRKKLEGEADKFGSPFLYERLKDVDMECASHIHPNDLRRIIRALEVHTTTGKKISEWQKEVPLSNFESIKVCLWQDMQGLYQKIEARVDEMLARGLVDEVRGLIKKSFGENAVLKDTIGYKEILEHISGKLTLDESVTLLKRNSRRLAKSQMTWFRGEKELKWVEIKRGEGEEEILLKLEDAFGLKKEYCESLN